MKKYVIETTATTVWRIEVEANDRDEAIELVLEGEYPDEYNEPIDHINEEIHSVRELAQND